MNSAARVGLALWLTASAVQAAEPYNGSQPMMCRPTAGHDCLPTENACKKIVPEAGKDLTMRIDIHANSIKTPFRNDPLPIQAISFNTASMILQGTSLEYVWSATVHRTTGKMTIAIADREGAYIIFGQCAIEQGKGS